MTREAIFEELRAAIVETFDIDLSDVTLASSLVDDLDLDSIDAIDLIVKMESLVGRKIEQDSFKRVRTVGDIVEVVHAHLAGSP
jgi:acyl carrier protein